jgi:N-glycosylase/DNA lyase
MDAMLEFWLIGSNGIVPDRMCCRKNSSASVVFYKMFRKAACHYTQTKILPHLEIPGPVEIDESRVGRKVYRVLGGFPKCRWMFGMYCRQTKIPILYYINDKVHNNLMVLIKKHVLPG